MKLADKVAVVTGGGQGLGRGIALELSTQGADVVLAEIDETISVSGGLAGVSAAPPRQKTGGDG